MGITDGFDSLYTAKKDIEEILAENEKNEKIGAIIKSKGLRLSDVLKNDIILDSDYICISSNYEAGSCRETLQYLIESVEEIKDFSKSTFPSIKFDLEFNKSYDKYRITGLDKSGDRLFLFDIVESRHGINDLSTIFLYTNSYRRFADKDNFARELFSIINKNVILKQIEKTYSEILPVGGTSNNESMEDAMKELGIELYKGGLTMTSVGGYSDLKDRIRKELFTPFMNRSLLSEIRKLARESDKIETNSALFYGDPGTGKTMMARAISNENGINFLYMDLSQIYTKWYGESAKRMQTAMEYVKMYANKNGKTVLFIDEIDSLGSRQYGSSESNKVLNVLLTYLSGIKADSNDNLMLIGCTNLTGNMDSALLSRFKSKVYFRKPDKTDRESILKNYCQKLNKSELGELAGKSEGLTGRDIESVVSIAEENLAYDITNNTKDYKTPKLEDYLVALSIFKKHSEEEKNKNSNMYS